MPRRSSKPVLGFEAGRELRFPMPRGERSEAISWSGVRTNAVKEPLLLRVIIRALQDADDRAAGLQGRGEVREQVDQAQPSNSTLAVHR
jgi:hypothetical protein